MSAGKRLNLGDIFPNFTANTTEGEITFHTWLGDKWGILFSHPADYTPVCTTELRTVNNLGGDFEKRNVKLIALSCDSVESHKGWSKDILHDGRQQSKAKQCEAKVNFPIIADEKRELAVSLGMLDPEEKDKAGLPLTCRAFFIIGPDKKLKLSALYPATTGRNFNEILRVVDSLQLTAKQQLATPADWKQGEDCMVVPSLSTADAEKRFGKVTIKDVPSGKQYMRYAKPPKE